MKEKYIKPELNVVEFDFDDIITTSPPGPGPCPTICPSDTSNAYRPEEFDLF